MPISYLSKPIETSPYVLPVDLNLLAKVNTYKQSKFYENAQKTQDELNTIANLDIANATHYPSVLRALLTSKNWRYARGIITAILQVL